MKIRGVDIGICCAEQKIAYNFAFMWYSTGKAIFTSEKTDEEKRAELEEVIGYVKNSLKEEKFKKFNIGNIIKAFRNGFENYCLNFFIATDYEQIGITFPIENHSNTIGNTEINLERNMSTP